jgi:hypothetical protein
MREDKQPPSQREVMRELHHRFNGHGERAIAAYAAAERRGDVRRASNKKGMTSESYARSLYGDGMRKGWLSR